jgi:hypothetical protein
MFVFLPFGDTVWERPHGMPSKQRWLAPREEVDARVRAAMQKWDVVWFGDPSPAEDDSTEALYWRPLIDGCIPSCSTCGCRSSVGRNATSSSPRPRNSSTCGSTKRVSLHRCGMTGTRSFERTPTTRSGAPTSGGHPLVKVTRDSSKHIDLAVCMVGAVMGARIALNSGKLKKKKTGRATFV